jgi:DNA polymerase-3 subunit alpha
VAAESFVHLHVHTEYSLLDGACKLGRLVEAAKSFDMPALAITDHGGMFGAIGFYDAAIAAGVKPIIGCELYLTPGSRHERKKGRGAEQLRHVTALAMDGRGYRNLMQLSTAAHLEGFYYKPRVDRELLERHSEGLLILSGCLQGEIARFVLAEQPEKAKEAASWYREVFGPDRFFLELQDHGFEEQTTVNRGLVELGRELGIELVLTNDVHYLRREDSEAHEILLCIQTQTDIEDPDRIRFRGREHYLKSPDEMFALAGEVPQSCRNTLSIADRCNLELDLGATSLPEFPLPKGFSSPQDYLTHLAHAGLKERFRGGVGEEYAARLEHELGTINHMGYAGYFLIVKDFVDAAKKKAIPVGPGRGSSAGSLVCYSLGITDVDPIQYNLLFERFLNPERVTLPDIDIDFCYERRGEVIDYVTRRYGRDRVAQIITFGTMAARGVIRDVGRSLKMTYDEVDGLAKMVPPDPAITLDAALERNPELAEAVEADPRKARLFRIARTLEGLARHASTHAAGVLVSKEPLKETVPLYRTNKNEITTQYDMKAVQRIGLLKIDFLGLRTLTVIQHALNAVRQLRGLEIDWSSVPLDDADTLRLLSRGETVGVFQLESSGMRDLLRKIGVESFEDIVAANALYRPGPMERAQDYIQGKRGKTGPRYEHSRLEPVLEETHGVLLYQEQVMQTASVLAGFTPGQADILRRAMGKKDARTMDEQRHSFVEGCRHQGVKEEVAERIFDKIAPFAGYAFPKSHSTAYSVLSYRTAYLKAHYPVEFMASLISSEMHDADRVVALLEECKRMGIEVLPPDVNRSVARFMPEQDTIRFGLGAVKNVGLGAVEALVAARDEGGSFENLWDLCERVNLRAVTRRALESLIQAGAMDGLDGHRAQLMDAVRLAVDRGQSLQREREGGQTSLFDAQATSLSVSASPLPEVPEWTIQELLAREKQVLGFYMSGHPLTRHREMLSGLGVWESTAVAALPGGSAVRVGGVVTSVKQHKTRNGKRMAFATLEDFGGSVELVVFADVYASCRKILRPEGMLVADGESTRQESGDSPKVKVSDLYTLSEAREKLVDTVDIHISSLGMDDVMLEELRSVLQESPGKCEVRVLVETLHHGTAVIRAGALAVECSPDKVEQWRALPIVDQVRLRSLRGVAHGRSMA